MISEAGLSVFFLLPEISYAKGKLLWFETSNMSRDINEESTFERENSSVPINIGHSSSLRELNYAKVAFIVSPNFKLKTSFSKHFL